MIPILYDKNERDFSTGGIGYLSEVIKATVTEERNGSYELSMQYPMTGMWYDKIGKGAVVKAKANETAAPQLFRIYKASRPLKGIVTYSAEHISYDLCGIPLLGFSIRNATAADAINRAFAEAALPCEFKATSDLSTLHSTAINKPCSVRALLGGQTGSILDVWGGEYEFDNFTVRLHGSRGEDRGVTVEYGKNLTDLKQEESIAECYTHLLPYVGYTDEDTGAEGCLFLSEKLLPLTGAENIGHERACIMDFSDRFGEEEKITEDALRRKAADYIASAKPGAPKVNLTVSFVQLWQTEDYKAIAPLERVRLCDTVTVRFPKLGIDAKAKVIKTVYDALKERYETITLGDAKSNFADTVNNAAAGVESVRRSVRTGRSKAAAEMKKAIERATSLITGNSGGYVVLHPAEMPQELLILDRPTLEEAVNVWRWNSGGFGHSSTGYSGSYTTAITQDGQIVADFITAGKLNGALIEAGTLEADTVRTAWNGISEYIELENGELNIYDAPSKAADERIMRLDKNGSWYYQSGNTVGWIGANYWVGNQNHKGLNFELEPQGKYMGWGVKDREEEEAYRTVLCYSRNNSIYSEEGLHLGDSLYCHNHTVDGANLKNILADGTEGWTGTINIVTSITRREDGGFDFTHSQIEVKSGIIVRAPRASA